MIQPDSTTRMCASLLTSWFASRARDLPWRGETDPYRVLVSEVMLQQTQVASCIPYYLRFIREFPDIRKLAESPLEKVLALWQGLGYYSRARNLHEAAREVVQRFQGVLPKSEEALKTLPGIGDYTAAAILALAYNEPSGMVDANIRRVLGRIYALELEGRGQEKEIAKRCLALSQSGKPRIINQALMELGATACSPRNPSCGDCPVASLCQAYLRGEFVWYGSAPRRAEREQRTETCVVATRNGSVLLARPSDGRWRGLWEFPRVSLEGEPEAEEVARLFAGIFGVLPAKVHFSGHIRHTVTRFNIKLRIYSANIDRPPETPLRPLIDADLRELEGIPMPSPMRKIARGLLKEEGLFPGNNPGI